MTALDLSELTGLERFLASGSGITGVSFARGCPLKEVRLPAVASLTALELRKLEKFVLETSQLAFLRVEDCPGIDTLTICKEASALQRGRLTGVDWNDSDGVTLMRLAGLKGYDGEGKPVERFRLTGKAHVAAITQLQLDAIRAAFPELQISYDEIVESVTVTFCNWDGTVLHTQFVPMGGDAVNPITAGLIDEPLRESDVEKKYRYAGWDKGFANVREDTVVTAVFSETDRYYRVTFWADSAESAICQEDIVIAHGSVDCHMEPEREGAFFVGWDVSTKDVVNDLDVHPVFLIPKLPESVPEKFDYLYSDNPDDDSAFSMEEFMGLLAYGVGKTYFQVGDRIKMRVPENPVCTDAYIELMVLGFNHYRLAGETEFAGVVFGMVGLMNETAVMHGDYFNPSNVGGWPASNMREYLNQKVYPQLSAKWRSLIRQVTVHSSVGNAMPDVVSSEDHLFLLSKVELGAAENLSEVPYCNEIDPEAEEKIFALHTNMASRIRRRFNGAGSAEHYWTRSPDASRNQNYWYVSTAGNFDSFDGGLGGKAGAAKGVCFACCMGGASK